MEIREFEIKNYEEVLDLWESSEGVDLDKDIDTRDRTAMYLQRNPGLSFLAWKNNKIVGAVLCGHDGRRGYLHHLAVEKDSRDKGIGAALVEKSLNRLRSMGIGKCHLFVSDNNVDGKDFWERVGWEERSELKIRSKGITL